MVLFGKTPKDGFKIDAELLDGNGTLIVCPWRGPVVSWIKGKGATPTCSLLPSKKVIIKKRLHILYYCPLESLPPDMYAVHIRIYLKDIHNGAPGTLIHEKKLQLRILEPKGEDAAYLRDFISGIKTPDPQKVTKAWRRMPVEWGYVLHPGVGYSRLLDSLTAKYPTSTYAGYALARTYPVLAGYGGRTATETVDILRSADFFQRHPTTYDHENPPPKGPRISMRKAAKDRADMIRGFLQVHPDFAKREVLEQRLGFLDLVLGRFDDAFEAWKWIAANGHEVAKVSLAKRMQKAMEARQLGVQINKKPSNH